MANREEYKVVTEAEKITKTKRVLISAKGQLTKAIKSLEETLGNPTCDQFEINSCLTELNNRYEKLDSTEFELSTLLESEDEITELSEEVGNYLARARNARVAATRKLTKLQKAEEAATQSEDGTQASLNTRLAKLPKIEIPKFGGKLEDFPQFWDTFKATVDSSNLPDVTKFTYLIGFLENDAKAVVDGFQLTAANYEAAKELLVQRYGRKEAHRFKHIQSLLTLKVHGESSQSSLSQLKTITDKIKMHIRSLEALDIKGDTYGVILTPLILSRLPDGVRMEWSRRGEGKESDLGFLLKFLDEEIQTCERAQTFKFSSFVSKEAGNEAKRPQRYNHPGTATSLATFESGCFICGRSNHPSSKCFSLKKMSEEEIKSAILKAGVCFKCLKGNHIARNCSHTCDNCGKGHHMIICRGTHKETEKTNSTKEESKNINQTETSGKGTVSCMAQSSMRKMVLQTARVKVQNQRDFAYCNILFDSGSDRSYVRADIAQKINAKVLGSTEHRVSVFGGSKSESSVKTIRELVLIGQDGHTYPIEAIEVATVCSPLVKPDLHPEMLNMKGIQFADMPTGEYQIDILLGLDHYWSLFKNQIIRIKETLVAQDTVFGYVLSGQYRGSGRRQQISHQLFVATEDEIRSLWNLESMGFKTEEDVKDGPVFKQFKDTVRYQNTDNRYVVALPWKVGLKTELQSNHRHAQKRMERQYKKLREDPARLQEYNDIFTLWEEQEIIEEVPSKELEQTQNPIFYLPHRPVFRESSTTTKVRPVFDGGAKDENGLSLNECLHTGPKLHPDLADIVMRFRTHVIGVTADISKAFLQVKLRDEDKDVTRFFIPIGNIIKTMRFRRLPFGLNSSPFLLNAVISHHLENFDSSAAQQLKENLYVDDLISGADTMSEAKKLHNECQEIMSQAGMVLTKWNSNLIELTEQKGDPASKVLGIQWDPSSDCFSFESAVDIDSNVIITKRIMLSCIAKIFDPLGFITPYTVTAKILFQEVWKRGIDWDDEVPSDIGLQFQRWINDLEMMQDFLVPRRYTQEKFNSVEKKLHVFCDASEKAYGAAVYIETTDGLSLVISSARIAPIKTITLPRLELLACVIGIKLLNRVRVALKLKQLEYRAYTDSKIVLAWIQDTPEKWKPFVANRVVTIQEHTDPSRWFHIAGINNPADLLTRGIAAKQLISSSFWLEGPNINEVLEDKCCLSIDDLQHTEHRIPQNTEVTKWINTQRWGTFGKAVRVVAWVKRFVTNCKYKVLSKEVRCVSGTLTSYTTENLSDLEISHSKIVLFLESQRTSFPEEVSLLYAKKPIGKHSKLYKLSPYLDEHGLMRIGGRLQNSELSYESKHPLILPNDWISKLLVLDCHRLLKHAGVSTMMSELRERYWILNLRKIAKSIVKSCIPCQRLAAKACNQEAGWLPSDRVLKRRPFDSVGIDYAGPLYTSDSTGKHYIFLITCMVTRAVHLELTHSLTVDDLLLAFRRFVARRGMPTHVSSDNAKTFIGAQVKLQKYYGVRSPNWSYIAPRSPWRGGVWERMVRNVKSLLKRTIGRQTLSTVELETFLFEIEYIVNSRPITAVTDENTAIKAITPNDFLIFQHSNNHEETFSDILAKNSHRLQLVWKIWTELYLKQLPHIVPHFFEKCSLKVGSVVLVREDHIPRLMWPLGVVLELIPGNDNKIRTVKLKTKSGIRIRPVQRLHHLETLDNHPILTLDKEEKIGETQSAASRNDEAQEEQVQEASIDVPRTVVTRSGRQPRPIQRMDL